MPRCSGRKPDGTPCERIVGASQSYCFAHDPTKQEARKRNAAKAGASKPSKELGSIKRQLQELTDGVLDGEVARADAAVAGQLLNTLLRCLETERKVREVEEVEERLAALEGLAAQHKGSPRAVR